VAVAVGALEGCGAAVVTAVGAAVVTAVGAALAAVLPDGEATAAPPSALGWCVGACTCVAAGAALGVAGVSLASAAASDGGATSSFFPHPSESERSDAAARTNVVGRIIAAELTRSPYGQSCAAYPGPPKKKNVPHGPESLFNVDTS
jgi:hypothetical protein